MRNRGARHSLVPTRLGSMVWLVVHYGRQRRRDLVAGAAQSRDFCQREPESAPLSRSEECSSGVCVWGGYPRPDDRRWASPGSRGGLVMSGAFQVLLGIGAVLVGEHAMGIDDGRWRVSAESAQVFVAEGQCGGGQEVLELGHRAGADDRCADSGLV